MCFVGNHAQGVAYTCNEMKIPATIFMPITTPQQKIGQVRFFGGDYVTIKLVGDTFDASAKAAQEFTLAESGPLLTRLMIHTYRLAKEQWAMKFLRKLEKNRLPLMLSLSLSVEEASFQVFLPISKKRILGLKSLGRGRRSALHEGCF